MKTMKLNAQLVLRLAAAASFAGACASSVGACGSSGSQSEAVGGRSDGGGGGGGGGGGRHDAGGGGETETGGSNLSFPVILSDSVAPSSFPVDGAWRFATITDPSTECVGEGGVPSGTAVDPSILCYYGPHVTVVSETSTIAFDGDPKVWWLQKRTQNFWKAFSVGHDVQTKLTVSAIDVGDLLESSPSIATRQIRTEFNMLQSVSASDSEFGQYLVTDWSASPPTPCKIPTAAGESDGCFAAFAMSGPVPGTQQTINEAQGTDFGPGTPPNPGTRTFVDPTLVRPALLADKVTSIPIHAIDYSQCARLVIQKVEGTPTWDPSTGQWIGSGVGVPAVNVSAYGGSYSPEINSGGGLVYGFNWNAKTAAIGTYRLTFVLDGNDPTGPRCPVTLGTQFVSGETQLVNVGTNPAYIIGVGDPQLNGGDEGGLVYIDLKLSARGGGGGGGGGGKKGGGGGEDAGTL